MKLRELKAILGSDNTDEYLEFERVESPRHRRPDICAFILLDELVPGTSDIVAAAERDKIWLSVDVAALAKASTREDIITLSRCDVRYDETNDALAMFV